MLEDRKILVTGATGQVARPLAEGLAKSNEVWCLARFTDAKARAELEAQGLRAHVWHLGDSDFGALPRDFTHVVHAAAEIFTPSFEESITANAEGVGLLMSHCRKAEAFFHVSSFAVYRVNPDPEHAYGETDPLGGYATYAPTYAVGKLTAEAVVRTAARDLGLRSTIARLNIAYGSAGHGGVPAQMCGALRAGHTWPLGRPNWGSPIHEDDLLRQVEPLLAAASVPATIVNWAGDDAVSERDMLEHISRLTGLELRVKEGEPTAFDFFVSDNTRRRELAGPCRVPWREGFRRSLAAKHPDLPLRSE